MKGPVDFIHTNLLNLDKIIRPSLARPDAKRPAAVQIEKSFVPEQKTKLPEAIRADLDKLK
jgi:hypothetical protein